jgi:hypothetical protein
LCRNRRLGAWLALLLMAAPLAAQATGQPDETSVRRKRLLVRSLLFPGLGQLGEKRYLSAALLAGGELFCLAAALRQNHRSNAAYWRYRQATDGTAAVLYRQETERHDRLRNRFLAAAAAIWALNLIDAMVLGNRRYGRGGPRASVRYSHEAIALGLDIPLAE